MNPREWSKLGLRVLLTGVAFAGLGLVASACSLSSDASSAIQAPLNILPESDVVVETNLQTAQSAAQAGGLGGGAMATTSGPSTSYGVISARSGAGRASVYAGFNQLSDDCLGLMVLSTGSQPVLGETQPGTYYFWVLKTTPSVCDAATLAVTGSVPSGWPSGDPSTSTWPASH